MEISIPIGLEGGQTSPTASVPAAVPEGQCGKLSFGTRNYF